ncbi:MAG: transglycosylase domain-containing protein, partial [Myxococcota bacterium]
TITEQFVKNALEAEGSRTILEKFREAALAYKLDKHWSKSKILTEYLNTIYFGEGAYGIEAAAQTYFGKSARDLQVHEAAVIAGVVPRPAEWNPHVNPEMARRKQQLVLHRMVEQGFLSQEQADSWSAQPLVYAQVTWQGRDAATAFFVEEVRRYLMDHFGGDEVLTGGLSVHTTLDLEDQIHAWHAVRKGLRDHDRRMGYRGPIRNVPTAEREAVLAEIGASNAVVVPGEDALFRALVLSVDDTAQKIELALGPDERTALGIADVAWAGPPNPARDGIVARVTKVGQALHVGDLVQLEDVTQGAEKRHFALYQRPLAEGSQLAVDLQKGQLQAVVGG